MNAADYGGGVSSFVPAGHRRRPPLRRHRLLPGLLVVLVALAGCIPSPRAPRRGWTPPVETPERFRQCVAALRAEGAQVEALPDRRFDNGCSATSAVKLVAVGIPVTNLGAVKCGAALPFVRWVRQDVPTLAQRWLGSDVVRIESFGSFACRPVNNQAGNRLSEHGRANAIDIAAFRLRDGRRISVKDGWNGDDQQIRGFLRALHKAACGRFSVVLGPDANALHHDHFHFDMGSGPYCR
ncbi:Extensin family protein [Rhizorhabdus wittichii RW1]|uniref:Extensin family protein n=1 Tax=Rhizorhabdus wittichii (strain DSM 6014 / CCUG 31198 / JCM 15750 / NBRC 105917 / EY 4224 / RW1) TaxID=392499 RepID=A0A9J9H946_RHIWR|nr:Extensin family protein [Rhizorhabdus wittichii RW1]